MRLFVNILAISGSAMFAGVLLAIGILLGGYWKSLSSEEFLNSFAAFESYIPTAIAAVTLPTLFGLAGSVWQSWGHKDARVLWLSAAGCIIVLLIFTLVWFAPTNAQFSARSLPIHQVAPKLDLWLNLHVIRVTLAAFASVLGIIATSR